MSPGDDVRWSEVPDGAMVLDDEGDAAVRIRGFGSWVRGPVTGDAVYGWRPDWEWDTAQFEPHERVRVVALELTGAESGRDLHEILRTSGVTPPESSA
jgi:hypothetical protein